MTDLERLLAIEEIKLLRHRWSRFVDEGSWAEIAGLLAPDAELDLTSTRGAQGEDGKCGLGFGTIRDSYVKIGERWLMRTMGVSVELIL